MIVVRRVIVEAVIVKARVRIQVIVVGFHRRARVGHVSGLAVVINLSSLIVCKIVTIGQEP